MCLFHSCCRKMCRLAVSVPMRVRKVRYPHEVCAATLQTQSGRHACIPCLVAALLQAMQADVVATFHVYPLSPHPRDLKSYAFRFLS